MTKRLYVVPSALVDDAEEVTRMFAEQLTRAVIHELNGALMRPSTEIEFSLVLTVNEPKEGGDIPFVLDAQLSRISTGIIRRAK